MRIDLHTHSNRSDGTDTPAELVRKARQEADLDVVALTDHDGTFGWDEAQAEADRVGIRLVKGVEISTRYDGHSVHLLGYEFDAADPDLQGMLEQVRAGRDERLPAMLDKLRAEGYEITEADVAAVSEDAKASGRPHVADALVAKYGDVFPDRTAVFDGWLNEGGRAYVDRYSAPLVEAITTLKAAGGLAVIAHPWASRSSRVLDREAFDHLADVGLDGIEVDHHDHDETTRAALRVIATDLDLAVTGSSDYHGTGKSQAFRLGAHTTDPEQFQRLFER